MKVGMELSWYLLLEALAALETILLKLQIQVVAEFWPGVCTGAWRSLSPQLSGHAFLSCFQSP